MLGKRNKLNWQERHRDVVI